MKKKVYAYKADRKDKDGFTTWVCHWCRLQKCCCVYETNRTFVKSQYDFRCPHFEGVNEKGILCSNESCVSGLESIFC